jgi:hypothetical protein
MRHHSRKVGGCTLELFSNGKYLYQWVQTMIKIGEHSPSGPYSYGTISAHLANASKITSFLAVLDDLSPSLKATLDANKCQLDRWSSHYNNMKGPVQYKVQNMMVRRIVCRPAGVGLQL